MQKREMEEAKAMAQQQQHQQQQQQLLLQQQHQQQQQQQQQQLLLLQQLQKQQHQQAAISRFPSNIDAHLRPPGLLLRPQPNPNPNPNSSSTPSLQNPNSQNPQQSLQQQQQSQQQQQQQQSQQQQQQQQQLQQQQQQQRGIRPNNQVELQMAYQDAWRVCHPDFKRPFASLEDACERLLPYHVVADYEAEEDDRILDSDTTGQMPSRSQQWDHNIAVKVAEFTATFEKQALAFNIITRKRAMGEFRSEERLMIEQALLQDEKRAMLELRAEIESREKASRDAQARMAAMVQAEQARAESQARAPNPIRASALGSQGSDVQIEQEQGVNHEMINGWGTNAQRDEKEPSEDFLNDEETENGDTGTQGEWREAGEFDLNTR